MKLERNRAERRSKKGVQIVFKGIPYLIFAALAAGFLLGVPQAVAASTIAQAGKETVTVVKRDPFKYMLSGAIGWTNAGRKAAFKSTDFTYTGTYTWVQDSAVNWRLKFLTSGTFTPSKRVVIDVFLVGGGGGGRGSNASTGYSGGGGGGGYTATHLAITLTANTAYSITVGAGGSSGNSGGATSVSVLSLSAAGGLSGTKATIGANGGSGGGGGSSGSASGGNGGTDGGAGTSSSGAGGAGQNATTKEFGETSGYAYSGGGGGGKGQYSGGVAGTGGVNGGGSGGSTNTGGNGTANTGGGGGGGKGTSGVDNLGGIGGSGLVIFRNKR